MADEVASPCSGVCRIDDRSQLCEGCWRTLSEIAAWPKLEAPDKLQILGQIEKRRS